MFVVRLVFFPVKLGTKATGFAAKTGYRTGRMLGYRRLFVFGVGVLVGLLIAPGPGEELRARLKSWFQTTQLPTDPDLGDRVRFELSHSPRTWHLPQRIISRPSPWPRNWACARCRPTATAVSARCMPG